MSFSSDGRGLDIAGAPAPQERRKLKLRPLARLLPYVARYRGRALAALAALIVAALTTLIVPVAVRRMIDFGFSDKGAADRQLFRCNDPGGRSARDLKCAALLPGD